MKFIKFFRKTFLVSLLLPFIIIINCSANPICDFRSYWINIHTKSPVISCDTLMTIPTIDNEEPLVSVSEIVPDIVCKYARTDMEQYVGKKMLVRQSVAEKLASANSALKQILPNAQIKIGYGYRHPAIQKQYYNEIHTLLKRYLLLPATLDFFRIPHTKLNNWINNVTHLLVAYPPVAGHPTGGAVDITIVIQQDNGEYKELDMGGYLSDQHPLLQTLPTYSSSITPEQQENRLILRNIMVEAGFAPFNGEWWHFSYGDKEWAAYYEKPNAIYSSVTINSIDELS
jgi:zinc D-Ala-D-Ala dipeptidase